jgi:hypothetical protein
VALPRRHQDHSRRPEGPEAGVARDNPNGSLTARHGSER